MVDWLDVSTVKEMIVKIVFYMNKFLLQVSETGKVTLHLIVYEF